MKFVKKKNYITNILLLCIKERNHTSVRYVVISKANYLEKHVSSVHGGKNQFESIIGCNKIRKYALTIPLYYFHLQDMSLLNMIILVKLSNCICKPQKHKYYNFTSSTINGKNLFNFHLAKYQT